MPKSHFVSAMQSWTHKDIISFRNYLAHWNPQEPCGSSEVDRKTPIRTMMFHSTSLTFVVCCCVPLKLPFHLSYCYTHCAQSQIQFFSNMAPRKVPNKRAIPAESSDKPTPTKRQKVKRGMSPPVHNATGLTYSVEGKDSQSQDQPYDLTSEAGDPKSKSVNHHAPARQRAPRKQAAIQTPCLKKELATWEGNKFPHYMSGNVYIIIHPTNKKYHYRLHSAVLAQSSSFISSLLQVKVVEASPKDATALKKQHGGLEVLLELKRSVDNPSEWVLTREVGNNEYT